jgi:AraC family transcriptional regulator
MTGSFSPIMTAIEAQATFGFGNAQIVRRSWDEPIDVLGTASEHRLEFAMLPRSSAARGRFPDREVLCQFERFGEVFFFPAGQLVHAQSRCRRQYSVVCSFRPDAVESWHQGSLTWTDARLRASLNIVNPNIRRLLARLEEELRHPGFAADALIELVAGQIGIELVRHLMGMEELGCAGGLSSRSLRLIDKRLGQDGPPPSLGELAGLCGLSVRHLTRGYRVSRQTTIGDHITERRIGRVRDLLASGMPLKRVAHAVGYRSATALCAAFRRATGERTRDYVERQGRHIVEGESRSS